MSENISKRPGKVGKDGRSGFKVHLSKEEMDKAGLSPGAEVDVIVGSNGAILLKPRAPANLYEKFLKNAVRGGVEFGEPIEMGDAHIIPIFAKEEQAPRDYLTVPEAQAYLRFTDTGRIGGVHLSNTGDKGVLVLQGQVFEGGGATQPRVVTSNLVLGANKDIELPSKCVHASKPIQANAPMKFAGMTPRSVAFAITQPENKISQQRIWGDVNCLMGTTVTTAALFADVALNTEGWKQSDDLTRTFQNLGQVANFVTARVEESIAHRVETTVEEKKHVKKRITR